MIDKETVERILDTADIVEVVSDFVHLRRRGANYIGLCPFHNEKTPSFSVSRAKGICKCFSCGKGGSPVNFIMEHEQISYYEALKYLAKKYNIEIKERELTDQEKASQSERESMLLINEFALRHFETNLFETQEGRNIGLSYFYERGFNDSIIKKFHLGYSIDSRTDLYDTIKKGGFNPKFAIETGLCIENERGIYDRYKGRVMFPVFNVAGKVVAFGGRTLKKDHAKYVNSPESIIYKKSYELYGLFQAKQAIVKQEKCYLVEGYTDVLSMHQAGIENVVASSGTSLTEGQIRLIHRFTNNVTVLYDGDAAGIKASLRGIDLLLAEGLNVKVLLLPDGDDPDSYAQKHNATEFQEYIGSHETDFIQFKTRILLNGIENDPIKKAAAITDIVKSISVIPSEITRAVYVKECSTSFGIEEKVLFKEIAKEIEKQAGKQPYKPTNSEEPKKEETPASDSVATPSQEQRNSNPFGSILQPFEKEVIRYVAKYGMCDLCEAYDANGQSVQLSVIEYIYNELTSDDLKFSNKSFEKIFQVSLNLLPKFKLDFQAKIEELQTVRADLEQQGFSKIRMTAGNFDEIEKAEAALNAEINADIEQRIQQYKMTYLERLLCSDPDDEIRTISINLISDRYQLSKVHTKYAKIETEIDRLKDLIPRAILGWKDAILSCKIKSLQEQIKQTVISNDMELMITLMEQQQELTNLRSQFAKLMGERVIIP